MQMRYVDSDPEAYPRPYWKVQLTQEERDTLLPILERFLEDPNQLDLHQNALKVTAAAMKNGERVFRIYLLDRDALLEIRGDSDFELEGPEEVLMSKIGQKLHQPGCTLGLRHSS